MAVKKLQAILMEQQDHRVFAAHSSFGWSAGERGRFEITKPFLECKNAVPTTEPQPLKAVEKCAAVSPRKAPSVIKTKPLPTQKPVAKAKAPAPPKTLEKSWQPWRVSVLMAVFLVALLAMTCVAFGSVDATSFASARGAQSVVYANITGDLNVACHSASIYSDPLSDMANPLSDMADARSSVLPSGTDLLHRDMRCNAAGLMPEVVHAKMLPLSALGLGEFQDSVWHQNATEGIPCMQLPVPTISSNPQLRLHDSGMSSSLAAVKEAKLLAVSADFKESASLVGQVAATACAIAAPLFHLCISAHVHHCTSARCIPPPPCTLHIIPALPQLHAVPTLRLTQSVWQCSKGETSSAIGHALLQRDPSGSVLRSSVGGVGWPPQWAPFFLAQMQPPPSVQQSFSISPNKPPRKPSPPVPSRSPTALSPPGTLVVSTVMRTTASDVALHRRHLNEVSASTVGEFTAAIADSSINKILLAAGTYELTSDMCTRAGVCIDRALTIEAEVPGAVVLNAMGARRVIKIQLGGTVELRGLNITGGSATMVQSVCLFEPSVAFPQWYAHCLRCVVAAQRELCAESNPCM